MKDYLYDCARIRAKEVGLVGKDRLEELLNTRTLSEALQRLSEMGVSVITEDGTQHFLREETLLKILREAYADVIRVAPDDKALSLWLYPYDCNNVKAAIKCFFREIDPRFMMFDFGSVSADEIGRMVQNSDFSALPPAMGVGAAEAMSSYSKNRDPQKIDLIMDAACYADMQAAARESGVAFAVELVRTKTDLTNILTAVRVLRMKSGELGRLLLQQSLLGGGVIDGSDLLAWYEEGEETLWERLRFGAYAGLAETVEKTDRSLTAIERCTEDYLMARIREAKFVPYGADVLIGYLLAREYEVKNLRILLAGKELGLPTETIRERMRNGYV